MTAISATIRTKTLRHVLKAAWALQGVVWSRTLGEHRRLNPEPSLSSQPQHPVGSGLSASYGQ
eukprot:30588-Eustigmatos_ZCMA.PRE.1